jgi:hypothetical protein
MSTKNNIERSDALTGTLTINALCEDGSKPVVNEFDIYYRYNSIYPNLTLKYGDNITGEKAYRIEFYRIDEDNMSDGVNPDYVVQTNGKMNLAQLTGDQSPAGEPLFAPVKSSTNTKVYEFSGIWIDWNTGTEYNQSDFENIIPKADMRLVPRFNEFIRYYSIHFYDHDGSEVFSIVDFEYNDNVGQALVGVPQAHFIYRDDSDLDANKRYTLKGW